MKHNLQSLAFDPLRNTLIFTLMISFSVMSQTTQAQEVKSCSKQKYEDKQASYVKALKEIQKGALLIEFPSYQKQVDAYDQLLDSKDLTQKSRARIMKLKESRIEEHKAWVGHVLKAFEEHYTFSEVRGYVKSDREEVGKNPNIWLNNQAEKISLPPLTQYYIISDGQTPNKNLSAYFFLDKNFEALCPPAPQYFRLNTFKTLWKIGAEADKAKAEQLAKRAQRFFASGKAEYQL